MLFNYANQIAREPRALLTQRHEAMRTFEHPIAVTDHLFQTAEGNPQQNGEEQKPTPSPFHSIFILNSSAALCDMLERV